MTTRACASWRGSVSPAGTCSCTSRPSNCSGRRYDGRALVALVERAGLRVIHRRYLNTTLLPVALIRSLWQRWAVRRSGSDESAASLDRLYDIPRPINAALTALMHAERWLGERCPPPFGMSMVCLARKPR